MNTENQNIYVQYIETDGADSNTVGTLDSELKINNKIYATYAGSSPIDITSNIRLVFNGDIVNGVDFEDQQSIKNNAPLYFASGTKLISVQDFISYFKGLSSPIKVKNSIAWGQGEIEDFTNGGEKTYKYTQNTVCYAISSSLYNTKSSVYSVIDVLNDSTNSESMFTVYGPSRDYLSHITDYLKFLLSYDSFHNVQYMNNPSEQWLKNIKKIRDDMTPRVIMGSKIYSFAPIVQYYDVVGNVSVDSLSKLQEYKIDVENEIYKWLDNNCNYGKKIYKSDIVKFFTKRPETSYVDVDIRVSDIIRQQDVKFSFPILSSTSTDSIFKYNINNDLNHTVDAADGNTKFNVIVLNKNESSGNKISVDNIKNKSMIMTIINDAGVTEEINIQTTDKVYETESNIVINTGNTFEIKTADFVKSHINRIELSVAIDVDFYSKSNFSINNSFNYGLNRKQCEDIQKDIVEWISNSTTVNNANRAIPLPYFVTTLDQTTRAETIMRKGILQNKYENQLTEKAFWMWFIPKILTKYYKDDIGYEFETLDINGSEWKKIDNLIMDLYCMMKPVFADSILDDNNNIVGFSMDNEIPVVRLKINYKYGN